MLKTASKAYFANATSYQYCSKMKKVSVLKKLLMPALLLGLTACTLPPAARDESQSVTPTAVHIAERPSDAFTCGGSVEARTWQLWDKQGRDFVVQQLMGARLKNQGDTYALYDIQIQFHNLMQMAQRCGRVDRLVQLADDLIPVYESLVPLNGDAANPAWICRGGSVCNARNRLVNTEVMLVSVQGLGLFTALADALAHTPDEAARSHPFVARTAHVAVAHLLRWGNADERARWMRLADASAQDVKNGSSALFFTDKPLWQIGIHAHLAGIAVVQPDVMRAVAAPGTTAHAELAQGMVALLRLFQRRLSVQTVQSTRLGDGGLTVADLDAGYWRLYPDNRFAGYTGSQKPAVCQPQPEGGLRAQVLVEASSVSPVKNLGWDFSHARRLVQVLDALERNRHAVQAWYGLTPDKLPPPDLAKAFAAQLVAGIWNGDTQRPLFANYWGGANGWYRVAYDNGTGACYPGYPPFGLSDSFSTGGYATWGAYYPLIDEIARSIYALADSNDADAVAFIRQYYGGLSAAAPNTRMVTQLMFWPTLVR